MKRRTPFLSRMAQGLAAVAVALVGLTGMARAQQPGAPPGMGAPSVRDPKFETVDRQNREATLRSAELAPALANLDQKRIESVLGQMKEDFRRIQIVRNDVARSVLANKAFDYGVISDETGEINKRAERLRTLLIPAVASRDKERAQASEFTDEEMKGALARLCHLIDGFVENPALKDPKTVDVEKSKKLVLDLLSIVDLSNNLKRSAQKLGKTPK